MVPPHTPHLTPHSNYILVTPLYVGFFRGNFTEAHNYPFGTMWANKIRDYNLYTAPPHAPHCGANNANWHFL